MEGKRETNRSTNVYEARQKKKDDKQTNKGKFVN
jgi:hypothetical protein